MNVIRIEMIRKAIEDNLNKGINSFVIYPCGFKGKMVKEVLNVEYGIQELALVDNILSKENRTYIDVQELKRLPGK